MNKKMNKKMNNKRQKLRDKDRMTLPERIIASSGGIPMTIDMMMVQTYLLYFYTDVVKINAAVVGAIFLVVRIISALIVPVFGIFVDRRTTPWGKYRPYYIIMGIPTAIFGFLTFTSFDLGKQGQLIYVIATYFLYSVFTSAGSVPKGAMGPMLTKNIQDRLSMGLLGYVFAVTGSMIAISGTPLLVRILGGNSEAKGFSMTMGVFAVIAIMIAILQVTVMKEKYPSVSGKTSQYSMKQMLGAAFHNRTAIIVILLSLSINLSTGLRSAVSFHYLKYYFQKPEMMAQVGLLTMIGLFGGALLSPLLTRRIGIRNNLLLSGIFTILTSVLVFFVPPQGNGLYIYILLLLISNFFNGLSTPAQSTLMPNAIDYTEWKTGMNLGAFMSSVSSFVATSATAFSGVVVGMILTFSGYQADAQQSQAALVGIKLLMSILPAVAAILTLSAIWLGDTEKQHETIVKELMERRNKA